VTDPKTPERMTDEEFESLKRYVNRARAETDLEDDALQAAYELWLEARRAREAEERLAKEVHEWRTARTHGGCYEDLRAEIANRVDAEDERDALRAERDALQRPQPKEESLGEVATWFEPREPTYECVKCGLRRTKAQGGTTFTVCAKCWDVLHPPRVHAPGCKARKYAEPLSSIAMEHCGCSLYSQHREPRVDPFDRPGEGEKT
jgi:hypothetical protein